MKTALAIVAGIFAAHAIPAVIIAITPEWLQAAIMIYLLAVLPIQLLVKLVRWSYKQLGGN